MSLLPEEIQRPLDEELSLCADFYLRNGVTFPNMREALAMDSREFCVNNAEPEVYSNLTGDDWQEYADIWLARNFSQQELEGEY